MKKYLIALGLISSLATPGVTLALTANVGIKADVTVESHASATGTQMREENSKSNNDKEVGAEVQAVIEEHLKNEDAHKEEQKTVANRPGWLTFLIGTDYKNLGGVRSELMTTENHIARLEKAKERTTDASAKAEIEAQIEDLKGDQVTLNAFITANESKFSLFGWLFKLFNK